MKRIVSAWILLSGLMLTVWAVVPEARNFPEQESLEGTLLEVDAAEAAEDACIQGSRHFVLLQGETEVRLDCPDFLAAHVERYLGKQVQLSGMYGNEEAGLACKVFEVKSARHAQWGQTVVLGYLRKRPKEFISTGSNCGEGRVPLVIMTMNGETLDLSYTDDLIPEIRPLLNQQVYMEGEIRSRVVPWTDGKQHASCELNMCRTFVVSGLSAARE